MGVRPDKFVLRMGSVCSVQHFGRKVDSDSAGRAHCSKY